MHQFTGKVILILILIAFFLGALVVTFNKNYTMERNIRSNLNYYPSVKIETSGSKKEKMQEEVSDQGY